MSSTMVNGRPVIENVGGKISTLQRLITRLDERIKTATPNTQSFMKEERGALVWGVEALKYHRSEVEGIGDVVDALRRLVGAIETGAGVEDAAGDAMDVLKEWDA